MRIRARLFELFSFGLFLGPIFLGLALLPAPSRAASFEVVAQQRFVLLEDLVATTQARIDAPDAEPFDATLPAPHDGSLDQSSAIGPARIQADLSHELFASGAGYGEWFQGESSLSLAFDLDEASAYVLDVSVLRTVPFGDPGGSSLPLELGYHAVMSVLLSGPGGTVFAWSFDDHVDCDDTISWACTPPDESFAQSGVLAAGSYALEMRSFGEVQGFTICSPSIPGCVELGTLSDGIVSLDLQLVPEPGGATLLALGIASLAWARRAGRRSARPSHAA